MSADLLKLVLEDTDELKITAGECRLRGHALQEAAQIGIAAIDLFAVKLVAHQADGDDSTVRVTLYERHAKLRPQPPALRRSGGSQSAIRRPLWIRFWMIWSLSESPPKRSTPSRRMI